MTHPLPTEIQKVPFHGYELLTLQIDGVAHAVMRPFFDALSLSAPAQRKKIQEHPVLAEGGVHIASPSAGGAQETLCLRLDLLPAWLATVNPNKVKAAARETVVVFQRESFQALAAYWGSGAAINPRATEGAPSDLSQSIMDVAPLATSAGQIAQALNMTGNDHPLFVLRTIRHEPGGRFIEDQVHEMGLLASSRQETLLTPTQIGEQIGLSARAVNIDLQDIGLQRRIGSQWEPTQAALDAGLCRLLDANKRRSDGTPIQQLKWYAGVISRLQEAI